MTFADAIGSAQIDSKSHVRRTDELHQACIATRRDGSLPGSVHWVLYIPAIIIGIVGSVSSAFGPPGWVIAAICFLVALILALRAWFIRWMTEIVVTDRRVIYVHGFIQRESIEVHMNQIESVDVDQTLLGRLFDYGDVTIRGTGTTYELKTVRCPCVLARGRNITFRSSPSAGDG